MSNTNNKRESSEMIKWREGMMRIIKGHMVVSLINQARDNGEFNASDLIKRAGISPPGFYSFMRKPSRTRTTGPAIIRAYAELKGIDPEAFDKALEEDAAKRIGKPTMTRTHLYKVRKGPLLFKIENHTDIDPAALDKHAVRDVIKKERGALMERLEATFSVIKPYQSFEAPIFTPKEIRDATALAKSMGLEVLFLRSDTNYGMYRVYVVDVVEGERMLYNHNNGIDTEYVKTRKGERFKLKPIKLRFYKKYLTADEVYKYSNDSKNQISKNNQTENE